MEYLKNFLELQILAHFEIYIRITVSALLGFFIGWDRSSKNKPAGLKTYTYVSVACTLITLVSIYSAENLSLINENIRMDPMRLAAQIVSGLGFLGAGLIIKNGLRIQGLTSAAMMFFAGGVGIGIGAGLYGMVIFSVGLTFLLARISNAIERKEEEGKRQPKRFILHRNDIQG